MITFKLNPVKRKRESKPSKKINSLLYAQAIKREDGTWFARVKTKGFEGYKDITILPFSEKTFELKGKVDVFYNKPDKDGHYTWIIRTEQDANFAPGNKEDYCPLCHKCIFQGYIIKTLEGLFFDIVRFIGSYYRAGYLVDEVNKNDNNEIK